MLTANCTRLAGGVLALLGLSAAPLIFGAPAAPATIRELTAILYWIQWQPLILQAAVSILLVVVTVAICLILLLLAKVLAAYATAFVAQLRIFVSGERSGH